jgi:ribosome recycling factor
MTPNQAVDQLKTKLAQSFAHFQDELKKLRTGRAHPSMLDSVMIKAYGATMPLNQAANVTAPEGQLLQITPFDPSNIQAIASAIRDDQALGLNPTDDGRVVRVPIPALTTERRQQIVKQLKDKMEDTFIQMRGHRQDAMKAVDQGKKDKLVGEDDAKRLEKSIDEAMSKLKGEVESASVVKEKEIMTV